MLACAAEQQQSVAAPKKIRASAQRYLGHAVAYLGVADSLFAYQGLDLEIMTAGNASEALPLLLNGQIDVLFGSLTPGAMNAMAEGQPVRIVAVRNVFDRSGCSSANIVESLTRSTTAKAPPVLSVDRDLAWAYLVQRALTLAGHDHAKFRWISVPNLSEIDGLQKGTIDYALSGEPWFTRTIEAGVARPWLSLDSLMDGEAYTYVLFGPNLLQKDRDAGAAVMRGYLEAVARYNGGKTNRNLDILSVALGEQRDQLARTCWPALSPDGRVNASDIATFQKWALAHKYIERIATMDNIWDSSFVAAAGRHP
jgi:NitT/TauT family transport system substrate-binding protein